jgi:hypothetical protein
MPHKTPVTQGGGSLGKFQTLSRENADCKSDKEFSRRGRQRGIAGFGMTNLGFRIANLGGRDSNCKSDEGVIAQRHAEVRKGESRSAFLLRVSLREVKAKAKLGIYRKSRPNVRL